MSVSNFYIVGVSGYLGSGKSTALSFLSKHGFFCIDADKIVHELYEPGKDGWRKIKDFFGEEFLIKGEGGVNRLKLGRAVFNNAPKLRILEKIIHPLVFNEIKKMLGKSDSDMVAIEAIKFDCKKSGVCPDKMIWIDAPPELAYKRFSKERDVSFEEYKNIAGFQEKPDRIDFVVNNDGTISQLKEKIDKLAKKLVVEFKRS